MICARSYQDIPDDPRDKWFAEEEEEETVEEEEEETVEEEEEETVEEEDKEISMSKKRIKMTDKELAIAMWIYVKLYIESAELCTEALSVYQLKIRFLQAHGKGEHYWYNACLLCQKYINEGGKCNCPLSEGGLDCSFDSTWFDVTGYARNETHRQKALRGCDKILKIMEAEDE